MEMVMTANLTPKQQEIREREREILRVARAMFLEEGYFGLTMGKIAKRIGCAKGTVYFHFPCKEELIMALAEGFHERRQALLARAFQFDGLSREKMIAMSYAAELYTRLNPGDMQIWRSISPAFREKISEERERGFEAMESFAMRFLVGVLEAAVEAGDLVLPAGVPTGEGAFGLWILADGGHSLITSGVALSEINVTRPYDVVQGYIHRMADSYGWRPLSTEWDYSETIARVQRDIFPEEVQRLSEMMKATEESS